MKTRIKIDGSIGLFFIAFTLVMFRFPKLFLMNAFIDNCLDFAGIVLILEGTYWRMAARGHKKAYSCQGGGLVTTGLYSLVRNPMYLGSFLIGAGFLLLVWPWWTLPLYTVAFYFRFNKEIIKEEDSLRGIFGEEYSKYYKDVPALIPRIGNVININIKEFLSIKEAFSTNEKRSIVALPALAVLLEYFQELFLFNTNSIVETLIIILGTSIVLILGFLWSYHKTSI